MSNNSTASSSSPRGPSSSLLSTTTTHGKNENNNGGEADKFEIFERWLRMNGAQFPLLELRKYDSPKKKNDNDTNDLRHSNNHSDDNEAEEKKDGTNDNNGDGNGEGSIVHNESEVGVAMMSLDGNNNKSQSTGEENDSSDSSDSVVIDDDGSKEMRGVHAKTSIPPQTICVSIPKSCLITVEMGQSTPIGRKILQSDLELDAPKHIFLMIYLLWDRKVHGSKSFFAPYYDILPKTLRNMPIFWNETELSGLRGSHLLVQISDRADAIREDYDSIVAIAPEFASVSTLDEFRWARMIVCSRNFGLLVNGHRTSALVPHADMLNHLRPRETKWTFCEETQCFTITSLQAIGAGEQVYDSYGQKCNHRFLLNYGFCVERNVEMDGFCPNEVPLELGLDLALASSKSSSSTSGSVDGIDDRECWEKKLAFWARGDVAATSHHLFGEGGPLNPLNPSAAGGAMGAGSSFHALAAAVAGASSTRGASYNAASSSSSTSSATTAGIIRNMASMSDASTAAALVDAMSRGMASSMASSSSPPSTTATGCSLVAPTICPVKRVRVCVSNNENTRILFSMLRVLACNSSELDRITMGGRLGGGGASSPFYSGGPSSAAARLFGLSSSSGPSPSSSSSGTSSLRTCRDIRYPINLHNERRAMEILLEIASRALSKYPTSLARDRADLRDEVAYPKYSNVRNAKLQVRGEKEVLHHFALWARTAVHVIDVLLRELESERRLAGGGGGIAGGDGHSSSLNRGGANARGANQNEELGYDYVIQAMEEDDDCHSTILRYCSDVLGAVRRDELNRIASSAMGSSA